MRRAERAIADRSEVDAILRRAPVLFLGLNDGGTPYVVPMHFGYDGHALYLHSARTGRKIEVLKRQPRVSFAVVADDAVVPAGSACRWSARYRSVMGEGVARLLESREDKVRALDTLLGKFAEGPFEYAGEILARTAVIEIAIGTLSGKRAGG